MREEEIKKMITQGEKDFSFRINESGEATLLWLRGWLRHLFVTNEHLTQLHLQTKPQEDNLREP